MKHQAPPQSITSPFDLVRLSRSKGQVDLAPNTIRTYGSLGLRLHKVGRAVFFSRSELLSLITSGVLATAMSNALKNKEAK